MNRFLRAVQCVDGSGNPYIHLRVRQTQLELGNHEGAKENLARAYMAGGPELSGREDAKYLEFLRQHMDGI